MKPRVLVTRKVYPAALAVLREVADVTYRDSRDVLGEAALIEALAGHQAVVCQLTDPITAPVLAAARAAGVRVFAQIAVGVDNIDVAAATAERILVTNTPDVLTEATADLTFALLLSTARRLPQAERHLREGRWNRWDIDLLVGADLHGRTLGLIGFGRIGQAVARRARGFGLRLFYHARNPSPAAAGLGAVHVPLAMLLARSDFVSVHVPLTAETRHLIGGEQLAQMPRHAILINTARGPIVDEAALAAALGEGLLAGAGLDVFEREPQVDADLLALPNVVLLPHIGSATVATRTRMCTLAAENAVAVLTGQPPPNPVNPEVLG